MKSRIVLHPNMGAPLLHHLSQFGDLPNRGILAGQAVDSAITDLYGKGGGVYNDLDIFRNAPGTHREGANNFATGTTSRSEMTLNLAERPETSYGGMAAIVSLARLYSIKSVSRDDMLNFVQCTMADGYMDRRLRAHDVIAGFDLNCTRVAIDLATKELVWDHHYEQFLQSRQLRIAMMHTPWHTFLRLAKKSQELPDVYADFEAAAQACTSVSHNPFIHGVRHQDAVSTLFGKKHLAQAEATRSIWTPYFSLQTTVLARTERHSHWAEAADLKPGAVMDKSVTLHSLEPRGALDADLQERCDRTGYGIIFLASTLVDEARRTVSPSTVRKLEAIQECRPLMQPSEPKRLDFVRYCADTLGTGYVAGQALPAVADKVAAWLDKHGLFKEKFFGLTLAQQSERMQTIAQLARDYGALHYDGDAEHAFGVLELTATVTDLQSRETMLALLDLDRHQSMKPFDNKPLKLPVRLPALFADFTVTEMRMPFDLTREGREMRHCVGGYSHAVQRGGSRILSVKFKNHRTSPFCSTVELKARFRKDGTSTGRMRVAQNFTHGNKRPNDENRAFVEFLCDYLEMADKKADPLKTAQIAQAATVSEAQLREDAYANGNLVRQLETQLREARMERRRVTKKLANASRKAALYTLLAETQQTPLMGA